MSSWSKLSRPEENLTGLPDLEYARHYPSPKSRHVFIETSWQGDTPPKSRNYIVTAVRILNLYIKIRITHNWSSATSWGLLAVKGKMPWMHKGGEEEQFYSFFNLGAKGSGQLTPRLGHFTPAHDQVHIVQEAVWAARPVWTGAENRTSTRIRSPDLPARSASLCRLSYYGPLVRDNR